jgi:Sulfotransferase domain
MNTGKYHRGRLGTHGAEEITAHIERVKQIIPPEKLLIYRVSEGWDRLVEWLEVYVTLRIACSCVERAMQAEANGPVPTRQRQRLLSRADQEFGHDPWFSH